MTGTFAKKISAKKWLVGGAALIVALGGFWYFTTPSGQTPRGENRNAGAPVRTTTVARRDMPVVEHTLGKVIANTMIQVTARVQGILDSAHFQEGQLVKKGDLLFQIDPRGFAAALAQAQAALLRDEAQLKSAARDLERYESLYKTGDASSQKLDATKASVEVLAATVASDKAAVDIARLHVDYTKIRSPVDGKTGPLLIQPGNIVQGGSVAPLVTIAQIQPIKISFALPQTDLPRIQARQRAGGLIATLDVSDVKGNPLAAEVGFTDNAVNAQSGTIELRATFDNADSSLVPGQLVNVTVELNNIPNALVVSREAVNEGPDGSYVYVVAGGKAVPHNVKVLFDDSKDMAVEGDLKVGDPVVVEGQLRVVPNAAVNVLPARTAAPEMGQ